MYAPMAPPKVVVQRTPYYGAPNTAPMPYGGGYVGYNGGGDGEGMIDGFGRGGGRHPGRGRGVRHGQGRGGGRHHMGRGVRSGNATGGGSNLGGGRGGRGFPGASGTSSSGRNTPEDGGAAVVVSPEPAAKKDPSSESVPAL